MALQNRPLVSLGRPTATQVYKKCHSPALVNPSRSLSPKTIYLIEPSLLSRLLVNPRIFLESTRVLRDSMPSVDQIQIYYFPHSLKKTHWGLPNSTLVCLSSIKELTGNLRWSHRNLSTAPYDTIEVTPFPASLKLRARSSRDTKTLLRLAKQLPELQHLQRRRAR
ncbi:hypothetical protein CPB86DRAFT_339781 [Serendipita vermifera]|nr:hypothetical protein CPB86DRAFT_339781 [Serendipita vermifera]